MALMKRTRATALDRDPLDRDKLDNLMLFLKDRLSPDDFAKFTDLIDDLQDDAEAANPSREMATDALPASIRRAVRREMRSARLRLSGGSSLAQDAARISSFEERYPGAARIKGDPMPGAMYTARRPDPVLSQPEARAAREASAARISAMMGGRIIKDAE